MPRFRVSMDLSVTAEDAAHAFAVALSFCESLNNGRPVELPGDMSVGPAVAVIDDEDE